MTKDKGQLSIKPKNLADVIGMSTTPLEVELVGLAGRRRVVDGGVGDVAVPVYHRVEQRMQRGSISVVGGIPLRKVSGNERRGKSGVR